MPELQLGGPARMTALRCKVGGSHVGCRPCKTLMMDEISTGLDSSTTFQITKILANFTRMRKATVLLALLQPAPEVGHRHPPTQHGIMSNSLMSRCSFHLPAMCTTRISKGPSGPVNL